MKEAKNTLASRRYFRIELEYILSCVYIIYLRFCYLYFVAIIEFAFFNKISRVARLALNLKIFQSWAQLKWCCTLFKRTTIIIEESEDTIISKWYFEIWPKYILWYIYIIYLHSGYLFYIAMIEFTFHEKISKVTKSALTCRYFKVELG